MKFDWVIVGAGFSGCVLAERIASELGQRVLIIERRDHIGGNAYDFYNEHGILVHKYGPISFILNRKKYGITFRSSLNGDITFITYSVSSRGKKFQFLLT